LERSGVTSVANGFVFGVTTASVDEEDPAVSCTVCASHEQVWQAVAGASGAKASQEVVAQASAACSAPPAPSSAAAGSVPQESPAAAGMQLRGEEVLSLTASQLPEQFGFLASFEFMAYSERWDCLILGTHDHHTNVFAFDLSGRGLREIPGVGSLETPFPGGGLAVGALGVDPEPQPEHIFVTEGRYDHIVVGRLLPGPPTDAERAELEERQLPLPHCDFRAEAVRTIGGEGEQTMLAPSRLCLDGQGDELWVVRGIETGDDLNVFISVLQASTGTKLGMLSQAAIGGFAPDHARGVNHRVWERAMSRVECFVVCTVRA